jgi:hypothetical protein
MKASRFSIIVAALSLAATAHAAIVAITAGTGAPAATLGGFNMTAFGNDARPNNNLVANVPSPLGGLVAFSPSLTHTEVGAGWATWSHGYTGDVYFTTPGLSTTLTLPASTGAFYFYAQPDNFSAFTVTATDLTGVQISQSVVGASGATYFGFYGTGGSTVASITVSVPAGAGGVAVGEFGIAAAVTGVPDGGASIALLGAALLGLVAFRRRLA